jgi:hypothetical protein
MDRCFFGDAADRRLYTSINSEGKGYLVAWQQTMAGEIEFIKWVAAAPGLRANCQEPACCGALHVSPPLLQAGASVPGCSPAPLFCP